ncbi:MAG: hypothetical protein ACKO5K_03975 [Armatimonadota bacterium]
MRTNAGTAVSAVLIAATLGPGLRARERRAEPLFTAEERSKLVAYWAAPDRWKSEPQSADGKTGPWAARLTPEGSTWLLAYRKAVSGSRKVPPTQAPKAVDDGPTAGWETWLSARIALDWHLARKAAATANTMVPGAPAPEATPEPPAPGPIPETLLAACGNPPPFARAVVPLRHVVRLDDPASEHVFNDNVRLPERFAYFRFPQGVVSYGTKVDALPEDIKADRFAKGGFSPSERRIFTAVSRLEGGFDTVQTYDTGFVSVGFIQFVTLADGRQSLCGVLAREKADFPEAYAADFRRHGIDVQIDGTLVVVDPGTGAELAGPDAVRRIVEDKRLIAVFQRAGRLSEAFQISQIRAARALYWPGAEPFDIAGKDGARIAGTVADIVRSEAGLATVLDRKINTGSIKPFAEVVAKVAAAKGCTTLADLAAREREIVTALRYRTDFLADTGLTQPGAVTAGR